VGVFDYFDGFPDDAGASFIVIWDYSSGIITITVQTIKHLHSIQRDDGYKLSEVWLHLISSTPS
jgi:hypothetical protein